MEIPSGPGAFFGFDAAIVNRTSVLVNGGSDVEGSRRR